MVKFLADVARKVLVYVVASVLTFILFLVIYGVIIAAVTQAPAVSVNDRSFLVIALDRNIPDMPQQLTPSDAVGQLLGGEAAPIHLLEMLHAIKEAAEDPSIAGIFLAGRLVSQNYGSSYAALGEIRQALFEFRETGKAVVGYIENASQAEYYLFSACSELILNPFGSLQMNGLATQSPFFQEATEKFGVGIQVVRVGDYKSAVEPFTRSDMSDESRDQLSNMLASIWDHLVVELSDARGLAPEILNGVAENHGILDAGEALSYGLVDETMYYDEALQYAAQMGASIQDGRTFEQIGIEDYLLTVPSPAVADSGGSDWIAVIYAEGDIVDAAEPENDVAGDWLARQIRDIRYMETPPAAAVLRVNSPGGSAYASEVIRREMELLNAQVPVVVSMGGLGASGGYWISVENDRIFVDATTITGSIGVFGLLPNFEQSAKNLGVSFDGVKTHELGYIYSAVKPKTAKELEVFQDSVNQIYDDFLDRVMGNRRALDRYSLESIAGGRVWSGVQAVELELADQIGGLSDAIAYAGELAGLSREEFGIDEFPGKQTPESFFQDMFGGGNDISLEPSIRLPSELQSALEAAERLQRQGHIVARGPIDGIQ